MAALGAEKFLVFRTPEIFRRSVNSFAAIVARHPSAIPLPFPLALFGTIFAPTLFGMEPFNPDELIANAAFSLDHATKLSKNLVKVK